MLIRRVEMGDHEVVGVLIRTILSEHGLPFELGGLEHDLNHLNRYDGDRSGFWVAELDGAVVGTIAIRPKEGFICELKRLYVASAARGHGLGRALYEHAESFARASGYETIWLDSSRRFVQARRLYEKMGFQLIEELDNDWEDNVYTKSLKS
jgi:GNAT superfamily N-acetyltransferase